MFDFKKLDVFFAEDSLKKKGRENDRNIVRRTRAVRLVKLLLPVLTWVVASYGVTAIMSGETKLKDISFCRDCRTAAATFS